MGNIFSGETEDFLLYVAIPLLLVALAVAVAGFETLLRERLRVHAPSWVETTVKPTDERSVHYRAPASTMPLPEAPRSIQRLTRWVALWSIAVCATWALVGVTLSGTQLLLPLLGMVAVVPVARTAFTLCDRNAAALQRIETARTFILVHHGAFALVTTCFFALFALSNQFFWNNPSGHHRNEQLLWVVILYCVVGIPSSVVGFVLASRLKAARSLYAQAPKESDEAR
jgi:hypothetical protein